MTSPDKLALASRAEQAGGPDRELDAAIENMLAGGSEIDLAYILEDVERATCPPRYTASLDAITALIAEKLPGCAWKVFSLKNGASDATVNAWEPDAYCATPALALCAAFLRALASTEDQP